MALAHKGLDYETVPLHFTEIKDTLSFANSRTVPVLEDGDNVVVDSWDIACYLEDHYPERPSLFGGDEGRVAARLMVLQNAKTLLMPLFRSIVADIYQVLDEPDKDYFRKSREQRIGCTIEEAGEDFDKAFKIFKGNLWPYSEYLKKSDYFSHNGPGYHDYILYGMFLWARATSPKELLSKSDPLSQWIARMDQLYDGLGGRVKYIG